MENKSLEIFKKEYTSEMHYKKINKIYEQVMGTNEQ